VNTGQAVFAQIMARIPHWEFHRAYHACEVAAPRADALSPWDHFLALCFAQMTFRQSLRDIEACLRAQRGLAYHLGFRGTITRSALARANEQRDWRPWALLARKLMPKVRALYQTEPSALDLDVPVIAVDSSLIDLSLAPCPWANFTGVKAALKLHAALDLRGPVPAFVNVTSGEESDMGGLDHLPVEPGAVYVMDRGYVDFRRLRRLADKRAFFVIRARPDVRFYVRDSRPVAAGTSLRADQIIRLNGTDAPEQWPGDLRRVTLYDADNPVASSSEAICGALRPPSSPKPTVNVGRSSSSSAGSSTACASRPSTARATTRCASSFRPRSASISQWRQRGKNLGSLQI
jgi:hypothetical protein